MIQVTLSFPSALEAAEALSRLAAVSTRAAEIAHDDRPDVGLAVPLPPAAVVLPTPEFNPFAAGTTAAPLNPLFASPTTAVTPPPVAQDTPEPAAAPAGPTPTVDATGLPWDGRIHGSTKSLNADGTWRQRRGLNDPALKARVEAELRAAQAAPPPSDAAASAGSSPAGVAAPVAPPPVPPVATPPAPPTVAVTPPPTAPAAPPAPAAPAGPETFGQLMARLAPQFAAQGAAATDRMTQALSANGLQTVGQLATRPDLIASVAATYDALAAAVPA